MTGLDQLNAIKNHFVGKYIMQLSDLIIANPHFKSFKELEIAVAQKGEAGERFLEFDVKPDYPDTPRTWELKLEAAFYWGIKPEPEPEGEPEPKTA
jgi:hypothetical protein